MDPCAAVAEAASQGLAHTFPGSKLSEANRLFARQLLDAFELVLQSELEKDQNRHVNAQSKKQTNKNKSIPNTASSSSPSSSIGNKPGDQRFHHISLSSALRLLASLLPDFGLLPEDSAQLHRLQSLLSPSGLWLKIGNHILQASDGGSAHHNVASPTASIVSGLFSVCKMLLASHAWRDWLQHADEGKRLAVYLCRSTVGNLGENNAVPAEEDGIRVIPFHASVAAVCWQAALLCLSNFPSEFVWSVIDWRGCFVPRLRALLANAGAGQAKQVCMPLCCISPTSLTGIACWCGYIFR